MSEKTIFFICIILILGGTVVFLAFLLSKMLKSKKEMTLEVQSLRKKLGTAKLDYVETKLNPHLFKNILNSVQSHAYQTYISLSKLSGVLDYVLYESSERFVTPQQEIEFTTNLIEINRIKINPLFDFRVKYTIDENDPVFGTKVLAPLITVDLIENAFKHTNFLADDSFILIHISFQKGILEVKVQNRVSEKAPLEKDHGGFGAQSLDQRLKMIYKNNFSLRKNLQNQTYTAHLKIDLHDKYNQVRYSR